MPVPGPKSPGTLDARASYSVSPVSTRLFERFFHCWRPLNWLPGIRGSLSALGEPTLAVARDSAVSFSEAWHENLLLDHHQLMPTQQADITAAPRSHPCRSRSQTRLYRGTGYLGPGCSTPDSSITILPRSLTYAVAILVRRSQTSGYGRRAGASAAASRGRLKSKGRNTITPGPPN